MHNVILFGEAGAGKSSIVNMIVGDNVAKVSNSAEGCTFKSYPYEATIGTTTFVIYDTAGLNEGDQGRVPHWTAIQELYTLIRRLDGVSLLIYCMRGRVKDNAKANWTLFNKVICGEKVPILAVVTGLETYNNPDDWLKDRNNLNVFRRNSMNPRAVGCVVSFPGRRNELEDVYAASQIKLRNLITEIHLRKPWCEEKNKWFASIYLETLSSGLCVTSEGRLEWTQQMRGMINEFIKETGMEGDDCKKLETTLLKAEKKSRRKGSFFKQ
jgi:GTPase SAR1 family protein